MSASAVPPVVDRHRLRARGFLITVNNPIPEDEILLLSGPDDCDYVHITYQYEEGTDGTPHIQAFVLFEDRFQMHLVRAWLPRAHVEMTRKSPWTCIHYCSKPVPDCYCLHCSPPPVRLCGPIQFGPCPPGSMPTKRSSLATIIKYSRTHSLVETVDAIPTALSYTPRLHWLRMARTVSRNFMPHGCILWGPSGAGKTSAVYSWHGLGKVFSLDQPVSRGVVWWDSYDPLIHEAVLLDDWSYYEPWVYEYLLRLCDRYPFQGQQKGVFGGTPIVCRYVYLTSNVNPSTWFGGNGLQSLARRFPTIINVTNPADILSAQFII